MAVWQDKILALLAAGWRLSEIGRHIGLSRQAMCDLSTNRTTEPKGMAAVRLHGMPVRPPIRAAKSAGKRSE